MDNKIEIVECPRDAMQGWSEFIPTEKKTAYLNKLLKVGFDVLDFGSFVSPHAIPQMADTQKVIAELDWQNSKTKLLAIIANKRGAEDAVKHDAVHYIGFPFSISETFQQRNTHKSIAESLDQVKEISDIALDAQKEMVIYISMGFGNPYGDYYSPELVMEWVDKLSRLDINIFAISDTIGVANPENIQQIFSQLIPAFEDCKIGAHFHSTPNTRIEKLSAAFDAGCRRFDSALLGIGGCPMAKDELVGNMATEDLLDFIAKRGITYPLSMSDYESAKIMASHIFINN